MKHYMMEYEMIQDAQARVQHDADNIRLARISRGHRAGMVVRGLAWLGGWMITQGTRLQARAAGAGTVLKPIEPTPTEIMLNLADR